MTHNLIDKRSLELHAAIAEKLRHHPELLRIAEKNIREALLDTPESVSRNYREWQGVIDLGLEETLRVMLDESDEGQRMRQHSPFCGILTSSERMAIFYRFEDDYQYRQRKVLEGRTGVLTSIREYKEFHSSTSKLQGDLERYFWHILNFCDSGGDMYDSIREESNNRLEVILYTVSQEEQRAQALVICQTIEDFIMKISNL